MNNFFEILGHIFLYSTIVSFIVLFVLIAGISISNLGESKGYIFEQISEFKIFNIYIGRVTLVWTIFGFLILFSLVSISDSNSRNRLKEFLSTNKSEVRILLNGVEIKNRLILEDLLKIENNSDNRSSDKLLRLKLIKENDTMNLILRKSNSDSLIYRVSEMSEEKFPAAFGEFKTNLIK